MALLVIEGFESVMVSKLSTKGWNIAGGGTPSLQTGRFAGSCLRLPGTSSNPAKSFAATSFVIGLAVRADAAALTSTTNWLTVNPGNLAALQFNGAGRIQLQNFALATVLTSSTALAANTWYYVELKVTIATTTTGSAELRINGVSEATVTGTNFGTVAAASLTLRSPVTANFDVDDLYVLDTTGPAPRNDFLGDIRVATLFPSADGANSAWTPNSGTAHFSRVNESATTWPDDDTSYVSDSTPGHLDTYAFQDLPAGATAVRAVQVNMYARKDDAGVRTIAPVVRQASTDYAGNSLAVPSGYAYLAQIYQQDPTGSDWSVANVNGDEFGVKEVA